MSARPGVVYLVGAGPGDPGLMTARSLELIATADAIYYDRLIPPGALSGAREDAELVYVGKQPGVPSVPQEEIGERLVEAGRAGKSVVRLKGGDPFVFGRGGEEGEALREADVEFEVVPGVTAGVAATAYAGIPVTHRDDASAVAFVTGHEDPQKEESALDWEALARFPGTLVFYMGVKQLGRNATALIEAGRDAGEPAAAIERGTWPGQRTVTATLGTIAEAVEREGVKAPALIVVGEVAKRREQLEWLERRPLHGRRVVVTRARAQASGLAATLRGLGAEVVELPAIRIEPQIDSEEVQKVAGAVGVYDLICLTSPNGVRLLFEAMENAGLDARALAGVTVAAIGPGTARALAERGVLADIVPERFVAEGLIEALEGEERLRRPRPRRPRRRGPRRPPRRAPRARRRGRRRRPLRDGARGARRRGGRGRPGCRLRHLHLLLDRHQPHCCPGRRLPHERPHRLDRPDHQRDRPRRRPRGRRRGRAPRHRRPPRSAPE